MNYLNLSTRASLALACAALGLSALAQEATPAPQAAGASIEATATETPTTVADASPFGVAVVDSDTLAGLRGGAQTHNDMTLDGVTAGNSARNVATGDNSISTGSFANMSGLPVVIQNSGANVLIQNAVILNLQMN